MSSDGSDIEIRTTLPKTKKNLPKKPVIDELKEETKKKLTTKEMIHSALAESKGRKGISLHAIKKHMKVNYSVDTEKFNNLIKKTLAAGVEKGIFVQTKGIGASGSFRLAPQKKSTTTKKEDPPKIPEPPPEKKIKKTNEPKKNASSKDVEMEEKKPPKKTAQTSKMDVDTKKSVLKGKKFAEPKPGTSTMTPVKKRPNMMKRKSIGSIIKAPKMKPKIKK